MLDKDAESPSKGPPILLGAGAVCEKPVDKDQISIEMKTMKAFKRKDESVTSVTHRLIEEDPKYCFSRRTRKLGYRFMESNQVQLFLGILLMISLFLPDSWVLGNPPNSADDALYSILVVVLFFFTLEIVILSYVQEGYLDKNNFFFWMDVLGTLSVILDIGWIADEFMPQGATTNGSLLRAARAAKLGARYGRIMRLLKLMKFFRFLPCFNKGDEDVKEPTMSAVRKVSNELSSVLSKRVAFLVLFMVILVPFLELDVFDYSVEAWLKSVRYITVENLATDADMEQLLKDQYYKFYGKKDTEPLSSLVESPNYVGNEVLVVWGNENDVRWQNLYEREEDYELNGSEYRIRFKTDETVLAQWGAMFGILLIILVILVLFGFSASFHGAVDVLVVVPLENMMSKLRESAATMLKSMKAWDNDDDEETKDELDDLDEELETAMLERMVDKLARLCKHMLPQDDRQVDADIDTSTAEWLREMNQSTIKRQSDGNNSNTVATRESTVGISALGDLYAKIGIVKPDLVNSFNFDTTQYDEKELAHITRYIFDVEHIFDEFSINRDSFELFVLEVSKKYKENPYHNFQHCIDVTHTLYRLLSLSRMNTLLSPLEVFAGLLAALGHDLNHPGVNNIYLVNAKHDLAIRFNDISPLENMHCSQLFKLLGDEKFNILKSLTKKEWCEVRKIVIKAILGTDMTSHHGDAISKIGVYHEVNSNDIKKFYSRESTTIDALSNIENRTNIIVWMLHTADISNPYKPFPICKKWAHFVISEFHEQGDKERKEGLDIGFMNDRNAQSSLPESQMGFVSFMVEPLISGMVKAFPGLYEIGFNLRNNFGSWADLRVVEIMDGKFVKESKEIDAEKIKQRKDKFFEKMAFVEECEKMCVDES